MFMITFWIRDVCLRALLVCYLKFDVCLKLVFSLG